MSQSAYYVVRSGTTILGRHCLAWPTHLPTAVSLPLLRRWYRDYPDAVFERDEDQRSTQKGVYCRQKTDQYKFQREARQHARKLLRVLSKPEAIALINEIDPS